MGSGTETALVVLVAVIALALVIQAISLLLFVLRLRKLCGRVEVFLDEIGREAKPLLQSARELLAEGREKFSVVSTNIMEITSMARAQVTRLDGMLTEASQEARLQFIRLDQLLTNTISRVEETGETVRRTILAPVREVSALLSGFRTALDFFFRKKAGVEHATQDEELFI